MKIAQKTFKKFLFYIFPQLKLVHNFSKKVTGLKNTKKKYRIIKMRLSLKIIVGSACSFLFIILIGFILFPHVIKSQVKKMVNLKPGQDIREMFLKVPFPLSFKVYIFSVVNPDEVQKGAMPILEEKGPFCYQEWKTKINVEDIDGDDTISYDPVDTFIEMSEPGCAAFDTEVNIAHPMILGMVNTISRQKPGALTLANKAIKSIWLNPMSLFITVKARDVLFDGVTINCGVQDFAGKAICTQLKGEPSLKHISEDDLEFSLLGPKNATPGKRIKAFRGSQDFHLVGRIVTYDTKFKMEVWNDTKCDVIFGTDGTIFPPMLKKEEGLASFSPDLCRALVAKFKTQTKYDGIPVSYYDASLGDQSKNPEDACYCTTPQTCLKKGLMDLYKCAGIPIYVSQPHFYDSDESYLKGVRGLKPEVEKHAIRILFEPLTGSPVSARKRLQFNMPLEPNPKVEIFHNFTPTILPIFWVEEGVDLNNTFTKPLKTLFLMKKIVTIMKYTVLLVSLAGLGAGIYLHVRPDESMTVTTVNKVKPEENGTKITKTIDDDMMDGLEKNGYREEKY
ncbi:hypothetical protein ABEB36_013677 [Hypothenemus hampei]|uniref:Sensory neuron membrane protein 1 n=1 Tax=Hypothenemus hampei TaxID=57062 RepID=A0ABD1E4Y0_HYPHA